VGPRPRRGDSRAVIYRAPRLFYEIPRCGAPPAYHLGVPTRAISGAGFPPPVELSRGPGGNFHVTPRGVTNVFDPLKTWVSPQGLKRRFFLRIPPLNFPQKAGPCPGSTNGIPKRRPLTKAREGRVLPGYPPRCQTRVLSAVRKLPWGSLRRGLTLGVARLDRMGPPRDPIIAPFGQSVRPKPASPVRKRALPPAKGCPRHSGAKARRIAREEPINHPGGKNRPLAFPGHPWG